MKKGKSRGSLFVVSAPSGAGKTTLCQKLVSMFPNLHFSVSYTTRSMRKGEVNNRDYTFVNDKVFNAMIKKGEFLEWAKVHGNFYGTSKKRLEDMLKKGIDVILDVDVQGAGQIREKCREGVFIFILPPSMKVLKERLKNRMANSKKDMENRLKKADNEIKEYKKYDYVIINDKIKDAIEELKSIIISEKRRIKRVDSLWLKKKFLHKPPQAKKYKEG